MNMPSGHLKNCSPSRDHWRYPMHALITIEENSIAYRFWSGHCCHCWVESVLSASLHGLSSALPFGSPDSGSLCWDWSSDVFRHLNSIAFNSQWRPMETLSKCPDRQATPPSKPGSKWLRPPWNSFSWDSRTTTVTCIVPGDIRQNNLRLPLKNMKPAQKCNEQME